MPIHDSMPDTANRSSSSILRNREQCLFLMLVQAENVAFQSHVKAQGESQLPVLKVLCQNFGCQWIQSIVWVIQTVLSKCGLLKGPEGYPACLMTIYRLCFLRRD